MIRTLSRGARATDGLADPDGAFYVCVGRGFVNPHQQPPAEKSDRVILKVSIERTGRGGAARDS
jgi:hypothetical protein